MNWFYSQIWSATGKDRGEIGSSPACPSLPLHAPSCACLSATANNEDRFDYYDGNNSQFEPKSFFVIFCQIVPKFWGVLGKQNVAAEFELSLRN